MQQTLPMSYPALIKRYMEQHPSGYHDTVVSIGIEYTIEPLGDESNIMRLTNTATKAVFNITEHDHALTYGNMSEVINLLRTIENQVRYTIWDWITYFTEEMPVYVGQSLSIYRSPSDDTAIVKLHTGKDNSFSVDDKGNNKVTGAVHHTYTTDNAVYRVSFTVDDPQEVGKLVNDTPSQTTDWLQYVFNNEYMLSNLNHNHIRHDNTSAINPSVWDLPSLIKINGQQVNINPDSRTLSWTNGDYDYNVNELGIWDKSKIAVPAERTPHITEGSVRLYSTMFTHYTVKESWEHGFAVGVVDTLNAIVTGEDIKVSHD